LRRQAEEVIVVNPVDPDNLLAGQNDSRIGFNHCGYDFSNDGGKTWEICFRHSGNSFSRTGIRRI
jgi:hypothetical protein